MIVSTKAIVLSKIKYKDHDLIIKCYTEKFGVISYLVRNALKTKKSKFKVAYFQPLSLLEIQADHNDNRSLQYLRDIKLYTYYKSLHSNVVKSTIVMFLSEVLNNILKEEEKNNALYSFLETTMIWFDETSGNNSFHLLFLTELTKYLGFYPEVSNTINEKYFNLEEGRFQMHKENKNCIEGHNLTILKQLLGIKFDDTKTLQITSSQKQEFLNMILLYFKLHLDGFKHPKSLSILNQVFS
jgi:DNA repair protein RecO (recombination protein O)